MFCHNINNIIAPQLEPYLPLCDFDEWIQSAERICNMGYDRFMDLAGHIEHCTDGKDELFPCYKGLYIDMKMSWGLLTASRLWKVAYFDNLGATYRAIYPRIKQCSKLVYDHLSKTCRHGPPVVRLIQDIRTVLSISQSDIASMGQIWKEAHQSMTQWKQHVSKCWIDQNTPYQNNQCNTMNKKRQVAFCVCFLFEFVFSSKVQCIYVCQLLYFKLNFIWIPPILIEKWKKRNWQRFNDKIRHLFSHRNIVILFLFRYSTWKNSNKNVQNLSSQDPFKLNLNIIDFIAQNIIFCLPKGYSREIDNKWL